MVKFFIDPGHGGSDSGAVGNGLREKDLNLAIALRIRSLLLNYENTEVRLSRDKDIFVSLSERANMANSWGANYFMSIHINSGGGTGFETFIHSNSSSASISHQNVIHSAILSQVDMRDRGKKRANFAVLRQSSMPAILTENGFIDSTADANKLKSNAFLDKVAQGHVNGLVKAFNLRQKTQSAPKPTPAPAPAPRPTGTSSNPIATFQQWLNQNYRTGLTVDGIYGPNTKAAAIRATQTELNKQYNAKLTVDGIWGPRTKSAFRSVRKGDRGNIVYIVQGMLYCLGYSPQGLDGIFGENTRLAVIAFQKDRRLAQDGIAGPNTFEKLVA
ncbi:N-acetylmuramoyl-L-alanine amidase [Robertmurraya massiliosenegalensis]|uniref:N-acetylmuramoyl-L-alanine amidase n=1 Tax=Robertmurraya massiliosenegalensis TaxID=1287657 RepID=UPI000304EA47|nr:N-acetylmuramoyl-L-alanine amidase [Robertmurraya massiliosenegalensis]